VLIVDEADVVALDDPVVVADDVMVDVIVDDAELLAVLETVEEPDVVTLLVIDVVPVDVSVVT
jgi:hypothetical protein